MELPDSLKERISNSLENLSPSHKQIARFVLDNRYFVSFATAGEVAEKNNTSAATVVRFAQTLGYEGYTELQEALRSDMPTYMTATARMQRRMNAQEALRSDPRQVFYTDINNIEQTIIGLSEENLNAALDAILEAKHIFVVGAGISSAPVIFLAHSLKVMGFDAVDVHGEGLNAAVEMARIKSDDLLIAVDLWRYVHTTVSTVAQAKEVGAPVIAITDSVVSPLAQMAGIAFTVATAGVAHSLSITALISLLNVLIAMLADRVPEQVFASLQRVDAAYRGNDLLFKL
jgi:DNA-binding MurR/RpiR family transcriptional regulator